MTTPVESPRDLKLRSLLEGCGAFRRGHFQLSSGRHSGDYVQCALLLESPARATLTGQALARLFDSYSIASVVAPALGGLLIGYEVASTLALPFRFAERKGGEMRLRRGFSFQPGEPVLLIEDVITTGKSTYETVAVVEAAGADVVAVGSIIDRTSGSDVFAVPFHSLLQLAMETFEPGECPYCSAGKPLESPGSRIS
jgi:orotate phosphoribosyltransferase